jgi:hypothetical protein
LGSRSCGVLNQKTFGVFRVVGFIVHQGFDEKAVGYKNALILVHCHFDPAVVKAVPFGLELVPPDIRFIKDRPVNLALAQKTASGEVGPAEMEMQGMVTRDPVKRVKLGQLFQRYARFQKRARVEFLPSEVDVDTPYDAIHKLFKLLHCWVSLASIGLRCVFVF